MTLVGCGTTFPTPYVQQLKLLGFERAPKRNQCHDEECGAASAAKNDAYKRTYKRAVCRNACHCGGLQAEEKGREAPYQTQEKGAGKALACGKEYRSSNNAHKYAPC